MNTPDLPQKPHSRFRPPNIFRGLSIGILALLGSPAATLATSGVLVATGEYFWKPIAEPNERAPGKWKQIWRYDPPQVESFQLTVTFDPARLELDTFDSRVPFNTSLTFIAPGILQITGSTPTLSVGGVDMFEIRFEDLLEPNPANVNDPNALSTLPEPTTTFSANAGRGDFITTRDSVTLLTTTLTAAQISPVVGFTIRGMNAILWDANAVYNDGTIGGSGTWNTTATRFDHLPTIVDGDPLPPALANVAWNNTANVHDIVVFSGIAAPVVTLSGAISAGGLRFAAPDGLIQSGTLTLTAPAGLKPRIETGGNNAIISSVIAGAGFQKLETGTLTLTGVNTYTGDTLIGGGAVQVSADSNLGAAVSGVTLNGGNLIVAGTFTTNRTITILSPNSTIEVVGGNVLTQAGTISGTGSFIKTGPSILALAGANTFTGGVIINGGTLSVNADAALGAAAGAVAINNNATLQAAGTVSTTARTLTLGAGGGTIDTNGNTVTFGPGSTITGTTLTKTGAGRLTIAGTQTYATLNANAGRTDIVSALGTGTSTINASAETNIGVSQTLGALNIGDGAVVTLGAGGGPAPAGGGEEPGLVSDFGGDSVGAPVQGVPEPGSLSLLLFGVLSLARRGGRESRG